MSYEYMTAKQYETLYARFLKRPPEELLEHAEMKDGDFVLDLCAGNLRASWAAAEMGASVVHAVDSSPNMLGMSVKEATKVYEEVRDGVPCKITAICYDVERFLAQVGAPVAPRKYDVVICQQAINYWFCEKAIKDLVKCMAADGRFVFNTFSRIPLETPTVKQSPISGRPACVEVSFSVNGMVYHVQCVEGMPPDVQEFRWISPSQFQETLSKFFKKITTVNEGNTAIYVASEPLNGG